jgi:small-conductance mechanosensitive channel
MSRPVSPLLTRNAVPQVVTLLRTTFVAIALLLAPAIAPHAQTTVPVPRGMTQEQVDALVDAIAKSVIEKLRAEGVAPTTVPTLEDATPQPAGEEPVAAFLDDAARATRALPALGEAMSRLPAWLDRRSDGGSGPSLFLLLLATAAAAAIASEAALRGLSAPLRSRLAAGSGIENGPRSLIDLGALAALDALGVLGVWLVCHGAIGVFFRGATGQDTVAAAALTGVVAWRLYLLAVRIVLRPEEPRARLCGVANDAARKLHARLAIVLAVIIAARTTFNVLSVLGTPPAALAAYQAITGLVGFALLIWLVVRSQDAARQWLGHLGTVSRPAALVGRAWLPVAVPFIVALGVTQFYGVLSRHATVATALLLTLNLVVGLLIFETVLQAIVRRLDVQAATGARLPEVAARCVRVAVLIGIAVVAAESWIVDVLRLVGPNDWIELKRQSRTAGIALFAAFVLWQIVTYLTEPYMDRRPKGVAQVLGLGDTDETVRSASRLSTIMPLLRVTTAATILIVTALIVLQSFGVNILPLLAGASVVGLAISFGSQSLVRDIVSGVFYLSDDAFRVGEYIDCGKAKGTVEGFTLRSIKLRHQNGQVHTIPFGQLGQVTNFSRDWITVKFNLRFARDTDVEKLRKAAKKIGAEMMAAPEYKDEILAPFKMQGVADVADNALVCRFKFTVRPGNPALIQREAIKRMVRGFPELGIAFATERAPVVLQAQAASPDATNPDSMAVVR